MKAVTKQLKSLLVAATIGLIGFVFAAGPIASIDVGAISDNAENLAGLIAVDEIVDEDDSEDLEDLIVLGSLFPTSHNANQNAEDLAALIALDEIVDDDNGFGKDDDEDLEDLIVLNNLFLDP